MDYKALLFEASTPKNVVVWAVILLVALSTLYTARTWWRLRHIPGPFLASLTDLYRMSWIPTTRAHLKLQACHDRYGKVVRIGPNTVSFSDPVAIPDVYPVRAGMPKVCLWPAM
jgi:hypothetical protein